MICVRLQKKRHRHRWRFFDVFHEKSLHDAGQSSTYFDAGAVISGKNKNYLKKNSSRFANYFFQCNHYLCIMIAKIIWLLSQ